MDARSLMEDRLAPPCVGISSIPLQGRTTCCLLVVIHHHDCWTCRLLVARDWLVRVKGLLDAMILGCAQCCCHHALEFDAMTLQSFPAINRHRHNSDRHQVSAVQLRGITSLDHVSDNNNQVAFMRCCLRHLHHM